MTLDEFTPATQLGLGLLHRGLIHRSLPKSAAEVDESVWLFRSALGRDLTPAERADVATIKALLGKEAAR